MVVRDTGFCVFLCASQETIHSDKRAIGRLVAGKGDLCADAADLHFTGKKSEGSPPVPAVVGCDAGDGVIRRHVKPGKFSVNDKEIGFGGNILPAHLSGASKISGAGFTASYFAAFAVLLQEFRFEGAGSLICGFELFDITVGIGRAGSKGNTEQRKKEGACQLHETSL